MDEGQRTPLTTAVPPGDEAFADAHRRLQDLRALLGRVIVGQDELITHLVTGYPVVALDVFGAAQPAAIEDVARLHEVRVIAPPGTTSAGRIIDGTLVPLTLDEGVVTINNVDDWETLVFSVSPLPAHTSRSTS